MDYKVVILAGGESSRFYPFNTLHKTFVTVCGRRVISRTLDSVQKTSPREIIVVLGKANFDEERRALQADGFTDINYVCQEDPKGMADAILCCKDKLDSDFFVINAQHFDFPLFYKDFVIGFEKTKAKAVIGALPTDEPQNYGILAFSDGKVSGIVEKPEKDAAPSNIRIAGIYLFSKEVLDQMSKSAMTEYLLEETLSLFAHNGKVEAVNLPKIAGTLKYPWDVFQLKDMILKNVKTTISKESVIEKSAILKGNGIVIEEGAHIYDFAIIEGPCYVGKNAVVGAYCQLRQGGVLEEGSQIERYTDVKNSLIGKGTHIHSGFIGDSFIGEEVRIGAGFVTANKRLDRKSVSVIVKDLKVDSGITGLGVVIGNGTKIGVSVNVMPGTIIGTDSIVYPGKTLNGIYQDASLIK